MRRDTMIQVLALGERRAQRVTALLMTTGQLQIVDVGPAVDLPADAVAPSPSVDWSPLQLEARGVAWTRVVLPLAPLVCKQVAVPQVAVDRREATLRREVAEALPVSIDEMAWDAPRLGEDAIEEQRLMVAWRREAATALRAALHAEGVAAVRFTAGPVAWLNLVRETVAWIREPTLVVCPEAAGATLFFTSPEGVSVRVAKRALPLDEVPSASVVLQSELARSLAAFRRQQVDWRPTRIVVGGPSGAALVPHLRPIGGLAIEAVDAARWQAGWPIEGLEAVDPELREGIAGTLLGELGEPYATADLRTTGERERAAAGRPAPWLWGAAALFLWAGVVAWYPPWSTARALAAQGATIRAERAPLETWADRLDRLEAAILEEQLAIEGLTGLARSRANWTNFLVDLQGRLGAVENVWIDTLEVVRESAPATAVAEGEALAVATPSLRLQLRGRLLDPAHPLQRVSPEMRTRVNELIDGFAGSEFIVAVTDKRFESLDGGLLQFAFTLTVNPERPL